MPIHDLPSVPYFLFFFIFRSDVHFITYISYKRCQRVMSACYVSMLCQHIMSVCYKTNKGRNDPILQFYTNILTENYTLRYTLILFTQQTALLCFMCFIFHITWYIMSFVQVFHIVHIESSWHSIIEQSYVNCHIMIREKHKATR